MRIFSIVLTIAVLGLISGCDYQPAGPDMHPDNTTNIFKDGVVSPGGQILNFGATLSGAMEVPPVSTTAHGAAVFHLSPDGTKLFFTLNVANIQDVTASHIHLAPVGENGPIVVPLYDGGLIPGPFNGVLASGIITSDDLIGPLQGLTLNDLVEAIQSDSTYVNVHTSQNPAGEIRGWISFGNGMVPALATD